MPTIFIENPVRAAMIVAGGPSELAHQMGLSRQLLYQWEERGKIPDKHLDEVSEITGLSKGQLTTKKAPLG